MIYKRKETCHNLPQYFVYFRIKNAFIRARSLRQSECNKIRRINCAFLPSSLKNIYRNNKDSDPKGNMKLVFYSNVKRLHNKIWLFDLNCLWLHCQSNHKYKIGLPTDMLIHQFLIWKYQ